MEMCYGFVSSYAFTAMVPASRHGQVDCTPDLLESIEAGGYGIKRQSVGQWIIYWGASLVLVAVLVLWLCRRQLPLKIESNSSGEGLFMFISQTSILGCLWSNFIMCCVASAKRLWRRFYETFLTMISGQVIGS